MTTKDVTNQQIFELLQTMVTKDDLRNELKAYPTKDDLKNELKAYATKDDLKQMQARLERKIDAGRAANTVHHLETRKDIGDLHQQLLEMREGLALAAGQA